MSYFRELPDISAVSLLPGRQRSDERILVKNIYKRAKLRTDIDYAVTAFDIKMIKEGERPDTMAAELYNDPELDWVIMTCNNITNLRNQWPLSNNDLRSYMLDKYGSEAALLEPHHYETPEIRDQFNRTVLKKGLIVDEDFTFTYVGLNNKTITTDKANYDSIQASSEFTQAYKDSFVLLNRKAAGPVSNFKFETKMNDAKRLIRILKPEFVGGFVADMRNIMKYETSSQYINRTTKAGYNPRESGV
jgi:hypothetical protein